jgi:hypothetical protein
MGLDLPRFAEDDLVDDALEEVCVKAERLADKRWLAASTAAVAVLSVFPMAARHYGGGAVVYGHLFDGLWSGVFILLFVACASWIAYRRHWALRRASAKLHGALRNALDKHMDALKAIYSFLHIREALERTHRLSALLSSRRSGIEGELGTIMETYSFLKAQLDYYRDTDPDQPKERATGTPELNLVGLKEWLPKTVSFIMLPLRQETPVKINDKGTTGPLRKVQSQYLSTAVGLDINSAVEGES